MIQKLCFSFFMFMLLVLMACSEKYVFEKKHDLEKASWDQENLLNYAFNIADTSKIYHLILELEHSTDYLYQNCYLKIHTQFPNGEKSSQVLSIDFADGIGRWHGDCNKTTCTLLIDLQKKIYFNQLGNHSIVLEQYMRKNPLEGISGIALKLKESEIKR